MARSTERLPSGWSEVTLFLEKGGSVVKEGALVVVSDRQMPPKASVRRPCHSSREHTVGWRAGGKVGQWECVMTCR